MPEMAQHGPVWCCVGRTLSQLRTYLSHDIMLSCRIIWIKKGEVVMENLTLTIDETAKLLRISRNTAYTLANEGKLPVVRLGRRMLVPRRRLEEFLSAGWQPPQESK